MASEPFRCKPSAYCPCGCRYYRAIDIKYEFKVDTEVRQKMKLDMDITLKMKCERKWLLAGVSCTTCALARRYMCVPLPLRSPLAAFGVVPNTFLANR